MTHRTRSLPRGRRSGRARLPGCVRLAMLAVAVAAAGCANVGRLEFNPSPIAPTQTHVAGETPHPGTPSVPGTTPAKPTSSQAKQAGPSVSGAMFGDTLIGLTPGTSDSTRRYLGRLRSGFTSDTLNFILYGDNRPGFRSSRLVPELTRVRDMFTKFPSRFGGGLVAIPQALWHGLYPDLGLIRDIPGYFRHTTNYGRERQVISGILDKIDSLQAHGQAVSAIVNSGDLVKDGRRPAHWRRFLRIIQPLSSRYPYFASPGNHERTDTPEGIANWGTATGLPVSSDRLYYCLDSADGWVRFIALDSNPIVGAQARWTREAQVKYSQEEFTWAVARIREHEGPVIVFMHHPPMSAGFHRSEWQRDSVLVQRREAMIRALHEAGLGVLLTGHEHTYQRALLTWPDAVLVCVVSGGAGAPLHALPSREVAKSLFAEYHIAGGSVLPENVYTAEAFHFLLVRIWFGGGELVAYAVDAKGKTTAIDRVAIDLKRYGTPQIDQHKVVIPRAKGPKGGAEGKGNGSSLPLLGSHPDSTSASRRLLSQPPPGRKTPLPKPARKR